MPTVTGHKEDTLAAALVAAQADLKAPPFDSQSTAFGGKPYRYASLQSVIGVVRPALAKHGLAVIQQLGNDGPDLLVTTRLMHVSGESLESVQRAPCPSKPQDRGGVITYLRRYGLNALLCLAAEEDDDAEAAQEASRKPQEKPTPLARAEAAIAGKIAPKPSKAPQKPEAGGVIIGRMERVYLNEGKSPHKIVLEDDTVLKAWQSDTEMVESLQAGEEYRFFTKLQKGRNGHPDDLFLTGFEVAKPAEVAPEEIPF